MSNLILETALMYAEQGMSVIPLHGKQPAMTTTGLPFSWSPYQVKRAPMSYIHEWNRRGYLKNIGIVCGKVSGNLAVIDLDGDESVIHFRDKFPELVETFTVRTGSLHGEHLYFYCDTLPPTTRTKGYELRTDGCYVVAPPSCHPDTGEIYKLTTAWQIMQVPDLNRVKDWITSLIPQKTPPPRPTNGRSFNRNSTPYTRAALHYELRDLYRATEGNRNNQLNTAAYNLGQLVGDGLLNRSEVERELLAAATVIGLDEIPAQRTIQSGLNAGINQPRSKQWSCRR